MASILFMKHLNRKYYLCNIPSCFFFQFRSRSAPGGRAERRDPGLEHSLEEDGRVLAREDEVENAQGAERVDDEPSDDGHHVHAELLGGDDEVGQFHDLPGDQTHDAERRVPARQG